MMVSRIGPVVCLAIAALLGGCSFEHTRGTMPPPGAKGQADPRQVPEFIAYVGQTDHVIGRVPSAFLLREGVGDEALPVYADDLTTVIGHSVPGKGFVPLGIDPAQAPQQPVPDAEPLDLSPAVARRSRRLPTHLGNELSRRIGRSGATAHLAERADAHPESGDDSRRGKRHWATHEATVRSASVLPLEIAIAHVGVPGARRTTQAAAAPGRGETPARTRPRP
jgi:hypothetical protein